MYFFVYFFLFAGALHHSWCMQCTCSRDLTISIAAVISTFVGIRQVWSPGEHRPENMHIFVGLKRTWDQKLSSGWMMSGQLSRQSLV